MNILSRPPALPTAAAESPHDLVRNGETVIDLARRRRDAVTLKALREAGPRRENALACPPGIA